MASSTRGSVIVEASVPTTPTPPPPVRKPTPKQDELNNKVNIENEILVALYRKREPGQMSENHRNEIKIWEANLEELKKKLHEAKLNQMRQKKLRDEAICRIPISGSAAHEPRRNEVIRRVKTLSVTIDEELEMKNLSTQEVSLQNYGRIF